MTKKALRIGGYVRVSKDEQKKFGFSIDAQIDKIDKWIEDNGHQLVDIYNDEGYTAGNMKRPDLLKMLSNLHNLDVIVFTRLDRFSRNVLEANKMLEQLQQHNVALISIEEDDIDTSTADGMFMFQLKVSLAERELKKGSERIKSVFEYKVKHGQPITGCLPMGYKIVKIDGTKKIGIDEETEHIVKEIFKHFGKYHSARLTMQYINDKYGLNKCYTTYHKMLKKSFYCGSYKGHDDYCPAYITKQQFDRNQEILKNNIRQRKTKHVYLYSKMIKCPVCGYSMVGTGTTKKGKTYYAYRCNNKYMNKACTMGKTISELTVESYIVKNIDWLASEHIAKVTEVKSIEKDSPEKRIKEILEELDNLTYAFRKRRMKAAEYDAEYEALENELKELSISQAEKEDITAVKAFLNSNWRAVYDDLIKENKRALWSNLIKEIVIDKDLNISIDFL